jgi:hypothetical protein
MSRFRGEPEDEDLVTYDHRQVWEYGGTGRRPVLVVDEDEDFNAAVRAYMERQGFYPNVWFISDHGNAHLINVQGRGRRRPRSRTGNSRNRHAAAPHRHAHGRTR